MADFDSVRQTIDASIKQNGTGAITGPVLNGVLNEMVDAADEQVSQLSLDLAGESSKSFNATGAAISGDATLVPVNIKAGDKFIVTMKSDTLSGMYRVYVRYKGQSSSTALQYKNINTDNEFTAQNDIAYVAFALSASDYTGTGSFDYIIVYGQDKINFSEGISQLNTEMSALTEQSNALNSDVGVNYKKTFSANSSEHSSNADALSVDFRKGDTIEILAEKVTGESTDVDPVFWFRKDGQNIQSEEVAWGVTSQVVLLADVDAIGLYIYPVTKYGTFSIRATKQTSGTLEARVTTLENALDGNISDYPYPYYGEKLSISRNYYNISNFKTLSPSRDNQSMVIYGDVLVMFVHDFDTSGQSASGKMTANIYNITSGALLASLDCPYGSLSLPHCNSATLGRTKISANSIMPAIYVSQWDNEKACLVYDIQLSNGTYSISLVQTINTSNIDAEVEGRGPRDWCVDTLHSRLYSLAYYTESDGYAPGNKTMVMAFDLPATSESSISFSESDIVDNFDLPFIKYRQDLCFNNGRIILSNGMTSYPSLTKISAISVNSRAIETELVIGEAVDQEPEGLDVYDGKLLMTRGNGNIYRIDLLP